MGTPYYNRRNFSDGGVYSEHEELKKVFNSKNWTIDFWCLFDGGNSNVNQQNIIRASNNKSSNADIFKIGESYYNRPYASAYDYYSSSFTKYYKWTHYAFVSNKETGYCSFYIDGINFFNKYINDNYKDVNKIYFNYYTRDQKNTDLQCYIAQFALRAFPVWTENFTPPNYLY